MNQKKIQLAMAMGLLMVGALASGQYAAADAQALAQKNGCMACHAVDKKIVGPSYKDVAAKYKDDPKAVEFLSGKVKNGGSGVWGQVPMPANAALSDDDSKNLVEWILKQ